MTGKRKEGREVEVRVRSHPTRHCTELPNDRFFGGLRTSKTVSGSGVSLTWRVLNAGVMPNPIALFRLFVSNRDWAIKNS